MLWFRASEVCAATGHTNTAEATRNHVDIDDIAKRYVVDSAGRRQEAVFVNESGLYALILSGKTARCKAFKRWVTAEVLPSIRRTGAGRSCY